MQKIDIKKQKRAKKIAFILTLFFRTAKAKTSIDLKTVKSILIEDFTGIGDLVMLIPFIRILRKNAPNASIDICCNSYGKPILENLGIIRNFYLYDGRLRINYLKPALRYIFQTIRFVFDINRKNTYDIAIEPRGDLRYIFFMHFIRAKRKISYNYSGGTSLLTDFIEPSANVHHLVDDKIYLLEAIGCKIDEKDRIPFLELNTEQIKKNKEFFEENFINNKLVIGIHPGASSEKRRWPRYTELVNEILKKYCNIIVLVFSSPGEEEYANRVAIDKYRQKKQLFLINENMSNYIRYIAMCGIFIGNDSGGAHIAAALGKAVIGIYGSAIPEEVKPIGSNTIITISNSLPCKPCGSEKCKMNSYKCLDSISVDNVLEKFEQLASGMQNVQLY